MCILLFWGPGSVVGIATAYGLDGPGIESRWGEIFRTSPDRPWGPPSLLYNGYRVFPGGKLLPGCDADPSPSPLLVQRSKIEQSYTSSLPKGLRGLWKGETYHILLFKPCILTKNVGSLIVEWFRNIIIALTNLNAFVVLWKMLHVWLMHSTCLCMFVC